MLFGTVMCSAQCMSTYHRAVQNYQRGNFVEAKQSFLLCQASYCVNDVNQEEVARYISLCNNKIEDARKALAAKRKRIADQEEQSKKQIEKNRYIFLSCDAWIFNQAYSRFANEITSGLAKKGYKFTKDKEKAYWVITISAQAKENGENGEYYFSLVDIVGSIYNTILDYETPLFITENDGSPKVNGSYEKAAEQIYRMFSNTCVNEIVEIIEK